MVEAVGVEPNHCIDSTELVDFRNGRKSKNDMISKSAVQTLYKNLTECHECQRGSSRRIPAHYGHAKKVRLSAPSDDIRTCLSLLAENDQLRRDPEAVCVPVVQFAPVSASLYTVASA